MSCRDRLLVLLALCVALLMVPGCDDDEIDPVAPSVPSTGPIFVSVQAPGGWPAAGATVFTNPPTVVATTSAVGTVLLDELAVRTYVVTATHPSIGSGNAAVTVTAGQVQNLAIQLIAGAFLQPLVNIIAPSPGQEFSYVETVTLRAAVSDDEDAPETLDLVWTSDRDGELSTAPAGEDGLVEVELPGLSRGEHLITLRATDDGGLRGTASVPIAVRSFAPEITIEQPESGAGYAFGDTVRFAATIHDRETSHELLQVEWRSDVDGVLASDAPDGDGHVGFSTHTLSRGAHVITLAATDADTNTTEASVSIRTDLPASVVLAPLTKDAGGINLSWTPSDEPDFASYRIYRATAASGPYTLIQIINDPLADGYHDATVQFGRRYWYRIGLRTVSGQESTSNAESIEAGIAIEVATQIEAMVVDPKRPYLYALDRINNSLLFVDLDALTVTKTIFVGSVPTDLDLDETASELFVANYGSNQIAVVDLNTQEVARNITVDVGGGWGGNPYRLGCVENDRLAWVSEDQWVDLRLVRSSDGGTVDYAGSLYQPDLAVTPDGAHIFVGESGISRSQILRFDVVGDQLQQVDSYEFGSYTSRSVVLSGDGQYVFYGRHKMRTANLSTDLGTLPEIIWATNHDGSIAFGSANIHDAVTFSIIEPMPVATTIMVVGPAEQILYLYDDSTAKIFLFDLENLDRRR